MVVVSRSGNEFGVFVKEWTVQMKDYTKRVWADSVDDLVDEMQRPIDYGGRMPVVSGFLRSSLMISTSPVSLLPYSAKVSGRFYPWDGGAEIRSFLESQRVGTTVYLGYQAPYADKLEYGTGDRPGYGFQRLALQNWPAIVQRNVTRLRATR